MQETELTADTQTAGTAGHGKGGIPKAIWIGTILTVAYFAGYYIRKLLGVYRPTILDEGTYGAAALDNFQSVFLFLYAAGQLINGFFGDYIPPRRMIAVGFLLSGTASLVFAVSDAAWLSCLCFAVLGFSLSMLRGPMMKVITENTLPGEARVICVLFCFVGAVALPAACLFELVFPWRQSFAVSAGLLYLFAVITYAMIFVMSKKGLIVPLPAAEKKRPTLSEAGKILTLPGMWFFLIMLGFAQIASSTIIYWLPSYVIQAMGQSDAVSGAVNTVVGVLTAGASFAVLLIVRLFRGNLRNLMRVMFALAAVAFALTLVVTHPIANIALVVFAIISMCIVGFVTWSAYLPSLGKSGKVSGANGLIDCSGYLFATGANYLLSLLMAQTGWNGMRIAWAAFALGGFAVAMVKRKPGTVIDLSSSGK